MSWRLASRLSVVTLALLVILVIAAVSLHNSIGTATGTAQTSDSSGLQGTDLGSIVAPDFRLKDQFDKQISLSQFKGKPVVLTFLYTRCPDICPLIANQLHTTIMSLGKNASRVGFLTVSEE